MTASVPTIVPTSLIAGDTWQWTRDYPDYPAGTWTAAIYIENAGEQISINATPSGSAHAFSTAASETAAKKAGRYKWWIRVSAGANAHTVEEGWLDISANPAADGTRDHRSWARRTLDAIESFLEGNASTAQASMTVQGRSISRWSLAELARFRTELKAELRSEERIGKAGLGRNIKVRFTRA